MQKWSYLYQSSGIKELINVAVMSKEVSVFGIYKAIDSMIIQTVCCGCENKGQKIERHQNSLVVWLKSNPRFGSLWPTYLSKQKFTCAF